MAFLANYRCAPPGMRGAKSLTLELVVSTPLANPGGPTSVNGLGTIFQSTNPPLNVKTQISGIVHMLNGPTSVAMTGTAFSGEENFQGVLVLPHGWGKPGSVSYRYVDNGEQIDVGPVDAEPIAAENVA